MRRTRASGSSTAHGIGVMNASYAPFRPSATRDFRHSFRSKPAYRWAARPPAGRGGASGQNPGAGFVKFFWRPLTVRATGSNGGGSEDGDRFCGEDAPTDGLNAAAKTVGQWHPPRALVEPARGVAAHAAPTILPPYFSVIRFTFVRLRGPYLTRHGRAFSFGVHRGGAALRPGSREGRAV